MKPEWREESCSFCPVDYVLYSLTCATWWLFILHAPHLVIVWMCERLNGFIFTSHSVSFKSSCLHRASKMPTCSWQWFIVLFFQTDAPRVRPWIGVIGSSSRTSPRLLAVSELSVFPEAAWSVVLLQQPDSWSRWQGRLLCSENTPSILGQDEKDMERKSYEMSRRRWQEKTSLCSLLRKPDHCDWLHTM